MGRNVVEDGVFQKPSSWSLVLPAEGIDRGASPHIISDICSWNPGAQSVCVCRVVFRTPRLVDGQENICCVSTRISRANLSSPRYRGDLESDANVEQ